MEGPYRAAKPLTEIIAPDRRKEHALVFGIACMIVGALLFKGALVLLEPKPAPPSMAGFGPSPPDLSTPPMMSPLRAQAAMPVLNELRSDDVSIVIGAQRRALEERCFSTRGELRQERVELSLVVAPSGNVLSSNGQGRDSELANCIATQAMAWRFPAHDGQTSLRLPFSFARL